MITRLSPSGWRSVAAASATAEIAVESPKRKRRLADATDGEPHANGGQAQGHDRDGANDLEEVGAPPDDDERPGVTP